MELHNIEKLLERYEEGKTSLAEEKLLRKFFKNEDVPDHWRKQQMIFRFSAEEAEKKLKSTPQIRSGKDWYLKESIAAILIVAMGLFFYYDPAKELNENDLGTITEEEVALEKAKETLAMVSQFMNEGKSELIYLKEFNNTTHKIIKID